VRLPVSHQMLLLSHSPRTTISPSCKQVNSSLLSPISYSYHSIYTLAIPLRHKRPYSSHNLGHVKRLRTDVRDAWVVEFQDVGSQRPMAGTIHVRTTAAHCKCVLQIYIASGPLRNCQGRWRPGNQVDIKLRYLRYPSFTIYYNVRLC